ncbi:MAG: hypothetical protein HC915_02975 [Anaerolineae bacterium]|nr:hypothetical protein [Anaerolineae bacterium]
MAPFLLCALMNGAFRKKLGQDSRLVMPGLGLQFPFIHITRTVMSENTRWILTPSRLSPKTIATPLLGDLLSVLHENNRRAIQQPDKGVNKMKREVGLWIDHRPAVIVTLLDREEKTDHVRSGIEQYVQDSWLGDDSREDKQNTQKRRFASYLSKYYDEVIAYLRYADAILILGPGVAKSELQKELEKQVLGEHVFGIETTDRMTDRQVAAKAREYFWGNDTL